MILEGDDVVREGDEELNLDGDLGAEDQVKD